MNFCWTFQFGICSRRCGWEWMERHRAATQWKGNIKAVKTDGVMYISFQSAWSYLVFLPSRKHCSDTMCLRACATYGLPGKEPFAKQGTVWYLCMCVVSSLCGYTAVWNCEVVNDLLFPAFSMKAGPALTCMPDNKDLVKQTKAQGLYTFNAYMSNEQSCFPFYGLHIICPTESRFLGPMSLMYLWSLICNFYLRR